MMFSGPCIKQGYYTYKVEISIWDVTAQQCNIKWHATNKLLHYLAKLLKIAKE